MIIDGESGTVLNPAHIVRATKHPWDPDIGEHWESLPDELREQLCDQSAKSSEALREAWEFCWYTIHMVDGSQHRVPSFGVLDGRTECSFLQALSGQEGPSIIEGTHPRWLLSHILSEEPTR